MTLTYKQRSCYPCKVCGAVPDEDGMRTHGRGCYTQSADGGGEDWVEFDQHFYLMKTYSIEHIKSLIAELDEFNSHSLEEITLTEHGKPIEITPELRDEWRFIGLSNQSFVEDEFWKPESHTVLYESTPPITDQPDAAPGGFETSHGM